MQIEKKRIEKTHKLSFLLKENNKLLDLLLKNLVDTSDKNLIIVSDSRLVYLNQQTTRSIGFTSKEVKDKLIDELFASNQPVQIKNYMSMAVSLRKKVQEPILIKIVTKQGVEKWFEPEFRRCFWKGKSSILVALYDSSKKNKFQVKEKYDETLVHLALKVSRQGIWDYNLKNGSLNMSQEFFVMLGYGPIGSSSIQCDWFKLLHPDSLDRFKMLEKEWAKSNSELSSWEYRIKNSKGSYVWMLATGQIVEWDKSGQPLRMVAIHSDIHEKKRIDTEKDENQSTLKGFIKNTIDGLVIIDETGIIREWNPILEQITQVKSDHIVGKSILDLLSVPDDINPNLNYLVQLKETFTTISHTGKNPWEGMLYESKIVQHDGLEKLIQQSIFTIKTRMGVKIAITVKDITESRFTQIKVEKSEERLKLALSAGNLGIWDIDYVTGERYISPMAFTILGYLPWELEPTEKVWKSHIHPNDQEFVLQKIKAFLISGSSIELEFRARKKDGSYIWILSKNKVIRDEYGKTIRVTGTISDISRQKNFEHELIQSQEDLTKNLAQHELISHISIVLNTNKPFREKNQEVIGLLGQFTNVSRVYIFENKPEENITVNTYEWCNKGIEPQIENLQEVPLQMVFDWSEGREFLASWNLKEDLPQDLGEVMISQGIQSFLIFPIQVCGKVFGYIGFDECNFQRKWERPEIELLKSISNIISFSYERELIQNHYRQNELRYRELTEKLPQIIFEVSITGKVEFLNQTGCTFFGVTKEQITNGLNIRELFPEKEVDRIITIKNLAVSAKDLEPVKLYAIAANKSVLPIVVYARPRLENSEIVSFTGIAINTSDGAQDDDESHRP